MRADWTYKTFGEVGTFLRGKNIQKADFVEKGLPCIHYGQIHTKFGISVDEHLSEIPLDVYNKSIIASPGDVIIAITSEDLDGSCKSTAWLGDYDVAVSSHAAVYKHNLNPKFIAYYLRSNSFYSEKEKYARGFKVMEIKPTDIARIPIPVPPINVQQSIVSELDKINELINLKKSQLNDYDSLEQSIFYDMFGDPVGNEREWDTEIIDKIAPCNSYKGEIDSKEGKYWLLNLDMVESMTGRVIEKKFAEKSEIGNSTFTFNEDNVLYSKLRPYLNKVVIPDGKGYCTSELLPLLPKKDTLNRVFLAFVLRSNSFVKYINIKVAGAKMPRVSMTDFRNFKLIIPPLTLQQSFNNCISAIEQQKQRICESIKDLENMLASRMQYWFD